MIVNIFLNLLIFHSLSILKQIRREENVVVGGVPLNIINTIRLRLFR